ncbi:MAG: ABC transporter substrate-binding protein [Oscillospiraceae bacterium]|jgi:raffinose/stachyose/melibiose transport system substrate-binding protein|nr:ABC transporter substrate-binding protein [Oscillospiraceae bacterium]
MKGLFCQYREMVAKFLILVLAFTFLLASCNYKDTSELMDLEDFNTASIERGYDLYIYNSNINYCEEFKNMCADYESETGIKVKSSSPDVDQDYIEILKAEINSKNKPSIFSLRSGRDLKKLEQFCLDFSTKIDDKLELFVKDIPESLQLTLNKKSSFGVPVGIGGYGYIVDCQMIKDLVGEELSEKFLDDVKIASYREFELFLKALWAYIKNEKPGVVTFSGNKYPLLSKKTGKVNNLKEIFSIAAPLKEKYGEGRVNQAVNAVFASQMEAIQATERQIKALKAPIIKYAKLLELMSIYGFSVGDNADYIAEFANGNSFFLEGGSWVYEKIEKLNPDLAKGLHFVPIKMPLEQKDIKVNGLSAEKFRNSISVFALNYYAINSQVGQQEQKLAQDFLLWLNASKTGRDYLINKFKLIPYGVNKENEVSSAEEPIEFINSLGRSILSYTISGNILAAASYGAPRTWVESTMDWLKIQEFFIKKLTWNEQNYENFADEGIAKWKKLKNE